MSGTEVTATDIETGESESVVIENDYVIICDGTVYLDQIEQHTHNGTTILTIKRRTS